MNTRAESELPNTGYRILFVEDNHANQWIARRFLGKDNELCIAGNGLEGAEQAQKGGFDIIFMDVAMPVLDGFSATTMIREWEQKHNVPRTPIIGAIASNWHREKCVSFGMDEVILKPLREKTLQDSLRQYAKGPTPKDNSTMV